MTYQVYEETDRGPIKIEGEVRTLDDAISKVRKLFKQGAANVSIMHVKRWYL